MIAQKHSIPLTQAVTASTPGRGSQADTLYHETMHLLLHPDAEKQDRMIRERVTLATSGKRSTIKATVIDGDTGLFITLTAVLDNKNVVLEGPQLTYGKLFLKEERSPQLSNNAIKLWR